MWCLFSIGNRTSEVCPTTGAASQFPLNQYYCYWVPAIKASWCEVHPSPMCTSSSAPIPNLHCVPSTSAPFTNLQCAPHKVHHSPISSVSLPQGLHQSKQLHLLQVLHPSSLLRLLQLHRSTVLLHLLATILCHVIMLLGNSTLSTILLLI